MRDQKGGSFVHLFLRKENICVFIAAKNHPREGLFEDRAEGISRREESL